MSNNGNKRGAIIAAVALVLVLVGAGAAYVVLSGQRSSASSSSVSSSVSASTVASSSSANKAAPQLGDYDATVYTADGEAKKLSEIANGKPLVINFWATWCPYCVQEFPDYKTLLSEYGDSVSFAFVDAPGSKGETVQKAQDWLAQNGFEEFPAYYDNDLEASSNFGARSLPTTVVVAANGEIQGASAGAIDLQRMRNALYTLTHEG
ncbi:MAG: TlpA family protein disulfide reductase [Atopobiaceae bacterium]|nr:TlpA family protein disulfide reductase [Atopobiaceae bacterium]